MKCIAAVVMVALAAVVADASYVPLIYGAGAGAAPFAAYTLPHTTVVQSNTAPRQLLTYGGYPFYTSFGGYPFYQAAYGPAPTFTYTAAPAPVPALLLQKEARYLAANRGAVHEAPLPGHEVSQQSFNLEPAAGTN